MSEFQLDTRVEASEVGALFVEARAANVKGSVGICQSCLDAADQDRQELHCGPRGETNNPKCACQHRHGELVKPHEPKTGPTGE
jgi:hypothetical protein